MFNIMLPSGLCLSLNTHLHPIMLPWDGRGTRVYVAFFNRVAYSTCIATRQFWSLRAWLSVYDLVYKVAWKSFFWMMPALDHVSIRWQLVGLMTVKLGAIESENENGIMGWRVSVDEFGGGGWVARVEMNGLSMGVGDDTWVNVEEGGAGILELE